MAKEKVGGQKAARRKQRKKKGGITAKRKKEFTFRGYTMEELLELPFDEMVLLLPLPGPGGPVTRGMSEDQRIGFQILKNEDREVTRTHRRDIPIIPQFVGKKVSVYNGKEYLRVRESNPTMIGHFTGEFSMTRGEVKHSGPGCRRYQGLQVPAAEVRSITWLDTLNILIPTPPPGPLARRCLSPPRRPARYAG